MFYYIDLESVAAGVLEKEILIKKSEAPSRAQRLLAINDVLFQTVRPYQKNNYFFDMEKEIPTVASTGYAQLRTSQNANFLYQLINTQNFTNDVLIRCTGSSYPAINSNDLKEILVKYPSVDEQNKIATFLNIVDSRIEKQQKLVEALKLYKRGVSNEVLFKNTVNCKKAKITEFSTVFGGYAFDSKSYNCNGIYKIITIGNVSGNRYTDGEKNKIINIPPDIQEYQKLLPNDIVISMTGNVGRVSYVNENNCLLNQRVAKISISNDALSEYVYQILSTKTFENAMINLGQGAAQKNIKSKHIENFEFCVPISDKDTENISKTLKYIDLNILKNEEILDTFYKMKTALLQQMFI